MRTYSTDARRGFTLLEAVASVAILSIALTFLITGHRRVVKSSVSYSNRARAAQAASAWLAERAIQEDWGEIPPRGSLDEGIDYVLAEDTYIEALAPSLVKLTLKVSYFDPMEPPDGKGLLTLEEIVDAPDLEEETGETPGAQ